MSLVKSLAKVAAGIMVAKGVGAVMKNRQQSQHGGTRTSGKSSGGLLDSLLGNNTGGQNGSLSDSFGKILSGRSTGSGSRYSGNRTAGAQGGLGGLLDNLGSSGGGLGGLLGGLVGGGATAGALAQKGSQQSNDATFGELFNDSLDRDGEPEVKPTPEQNAVAGIMLKAMIQAAKSDGRIDDAEKQRLMGHLDNDLDDDERQFIREQMSAPVDAAALASEVPKGQEAQVYLMSLLAIDFDNEEEARYLNALAEAMGLSRDKVNQIHQEAGVAPLYNS